MIDPLLRFVIQHRVLVVIAVVLSVALQKHGRVSEDALELIGDDEVLRGGPMNSRSDNEG